jgi:hypothetical protein
VGKRSMRFGDSAGVGGCYRYNYSRLVFPFPTLSSILERKLYFV